MSYVSHSSGVEATIIHSQDLQSIFFPPSVPPPGIPVSSTSTLEALLCWCPFSSNIAGPPPSHAPAARASPCWDSPSMATCFRSVSWMRCLESKHSQTNILKFGSKHCSNHCSSGHWQAWLRLALTSLIILGAYAIRVRHAMKTAGADGVRWSHGSPDCYRADEESVDV